MRITAGMTFTREVLQHSCEVQSAAHLDVYPAWPFASLPESPLARPAKAFSHFSQLILLCGLVSAGRQLLAVRNFMSFSHPLHMHPDWNAR